MNLYQRFELLRLVRDDGVKSFEGVEKSTGRPVLAHLFVNPQAVSSRVMLEQLGHLPQADLRRVVDRGTHEGTPYVITDRLADYPGLSEFLIAKTRKPGAEQPAANPQPSLDSAGAWRVPAPAPPVPRAPQPASESSVDEQFANLFDSSELPVAAQRTPVVTPRPQSRPLREETPWAAPDQRGEFTRMFEAVPPPAPPAPPATHQPGPFTQMLRTPAGQGPQADRAADRDGEFTKAFLRSPEPLPAAPPSLPPLPRTRPGEDKGAFTQAFGPQNIPPPPPNAQPMAPVAQTPLLDGPTQPFAVPKLGDIPPPPPQPLPAAPPDQGDFTNRFSVPAQLTLGQPSPGAPAGPPGVAPGGSTAPANSRLPLILAISAGGILILAVLIYLVLRLH